MVYHKKDNCSTKRCINCGLTIIENPICNKYHQDKKCIPELKQKNFTIINEIDKIKEKIKNKK